MQANDGPLMTNMPPNWASRGIARWWLLVIMAIGSAVLLGVGAMLLQRSEGVPAGSPSTTASSSQPAADDQSAGGGRSLPSEMQPTSQLVDVQVVNPTRRDVAYSISLPANVAPLYQTTLYAKVSGYLKWIGPDKGDRVKKDQVLAVIDAPEVEEQYQQAVADYKIKKITYERLANVWKQTPDVIAKQDVDVAEALFEGARHLMEQRMALRDYTKVRAPYSGTITARFVDPGALIQVAMTSSAGAIPLFTIMDLETVRVYANVPQEDRLWPKSARRLCWR